MFEKVNPSHPDKIADRIAGALVDIAYRQQKNPKVAVEVLIGHGKCHIIAETTTLYIDSEIKRVVERIAGEGIEVEFNHVPQDLHLFQNQTKGIKCGDNGIFCGMPITLEQKELTEFAKKLYKGYPYDGKYIIAHDHLIVCQSNIETHTLAADIIGDEEVRRFADKVTVNPLGYWTGGTNVDSGATNRKLGSDMGDAVTGGGLHGKDLSKADVSVNIYCHIKAQQRGMPYKTFCAIGDEKIDGVPYSEIVEIAREYIEKIGGFEKFAEWGLIR